MMMMRRHFALGNTLRSMRVGFGPSSSQIVCCNLTIQDLSCRFYATEGLLSIIPNTIFGQQMNSPSPSGDNNVPTKVDVKITEGTEIKGGQEVKGTQLEGGEVLREGTEVVGDLDIPTNASEVITFFKK